jgi:putative exporter of polyketide antibiotics
VALRPKGLGRLRGRRDGGGYILILLGLALAWPGWVIDLSPLTHLAYMPAAPFAVTSAIAMALIGCAAGACGVAAFSRNQIFDGAPPPT